MKKLKKVLSLVLVLAMALSLFGANVFAAGTTDYTDDAELTYGSQAVAAMSELGIVNGFEDGSFKPSEGYTREQAAKVITYMLATPEVAEKLDAPAKDVFADVKADRWSAADVAYAVDKKIIAGYGDGNFGPEDALTRDQWLKMLLVALGKDPIKEGLQGDNWDTRAAALAMRTFITPSEYEHEWNRETAVYYAFKAMTCYEVNGQTLAQKIYKLTPVVNYDDFGAPVTLTLTNGKSATSAYYKEYATIELFADDDWSNKVTKLAKVENYDETTWEVYVDGVKVEDPATVGCNSADVKVYKKADHTYRVIVKENYFDAGSKSEYTIGRYHINDGVVHPGAKLAAVPQTVTKKDTETGAIELDGTPVEFACKAQIKDTCVRVKYDVYYDSYDNVIAMDDFHPYAPEAELVYVYDSVVTAEPIVDGTGYDKVVGKEYTAQAKIMRLDGTLEVVDLATARVGGTTYIVNKYGYAEGNELADGSLTKSEYFENVINISRDYDVPVFSTGRSIYTVTDKEQEGPLGNFYYMYTFEDGTVTLEASEGDTDWIATKPNDFTVEGVTGALAPHANGSTKITVITIDPAMVANGEVTKDAVGLKNFDEDEYLDANVKLNAKGTAITEIVAIAVKQPAVKTVYGIYLGTTVETIEDGLNYKFGLSDGSTVEFTARVDNDANYIDLTEGKVYAVTLTEGKLTDRKELNPELYGYAVEDDGYFVLQDENGPKQINYADDFGRKAWGQPEGKWIPVQPQTSENNDGKGDYVLLYKDGGDVIFATVLYGYTKNVELTGKLAATSTAPGYKIILDKPEDPKSNVETDDIGGDVSQIVVTGWKATALAVNEEIELSDLYLDKPFTAYMTLTVEPCYPDMIVSYKLNSLSTADKYEMVDEYLSGYSYENGVVTIETGLGSKQYYAKPEVTVTIDGYPSTLQELDDSFAQLLTSWHVGAEMLVKNNTEILSINIQLLPQE